MLRRKRQQFEKNECVNFGWRELESICEKKNADESERRNTGNCKNKKTQMDDRKGKKMRKMIFDNRYYKDPREV